MEPRDWTEISADLSRDEWGWLELIIGGLGSFVFLAFVVIIW